LVNEAFDFNYTDKHETITKYLRIMVKIEVKISVTNVCSKVLVQPKG